MDRKDYDRRYVKKNPWVKHMHNMLNRIKNRPNYNGTSGHKIKIKCQITVAD
jgi:hypothetical protein